MLHTVVDIIRNSILITGLVVIMMMMIESLNIESRGLFFAGLRKTKFGQVIIAALLGAIPGCMGGFATVSLYTHGLFSFGALTAMMISSSGDEAFMMLAMVPDKALTIFAVLFSVAVIVGLVTDYVYGYMFRNSCGDGYVVHENDRQADTETEKETGRRHFGWKRAVMFIGVALFIVALTTGHLSHHHGDHDIHNAGGINLLSEDWMNVLFAALSVIVLAVLCLASDHFIEDHLWKHIVRKHLPSIFLWTLGVLAFVGVILQYVDIGKWISDNTVLMILLATAVGIIPESGPHMVFVTLYASGIVPLPVLLASSISQDGHASIPLLAESKKSFLYAKAINCVTAVVVGLIAYFIM